MAVNLPVGGNVIGVGTDIIEIERLEASCKNYEQRFLDRVFTKEEQRYCFDKANPYVHLAGRFAVKEAVSKAFAVGIGAELDWTSIEVIKGERDEPLVRLDEKGKALLAAVGGTDVLISLSHAKTLAQAVAIVVR